MRNGTDGVKMRNGTDMSFKLSFNLIFVPLSHFNLTLYFVLFHFLPSSMHGMLSACAFDLKQLLLYLAVEIFRMFTNYMKVMHFITS
jgi:hypothetical protein